MDKASWHGGDAAMVELEETAETFEQWKIRVGTNGASVQAPRGRCWVCFHPGNDREWYLQQARLFITEQNRREQEVIDRAEKLIRANANPCNTAE